MHACSLEDGKDGLADRMFAHCQPSLSASVNPGGMTKFKLPPGIDEVTLIRRAAATEEKLTISNSPEDEVFHLNSGQDLLLPLFVFGNWRGFQPSTLQAC